MKNPIELLKRIRSAAVACSNEQFVQDGKSVELAERIVKMVDDEFYEEVRTALEEQEATPEGADYFYKFTEWDETHHDLESLLECADYDGVVIEVGRLKALPNSFIAIYTNENEERENKEFPTKEEAEQFLNENHHKDFNND